MTWEWTFLISIFLVCVTAFLYRVILYIEKFTELDKIDSRFDESLARIGKANSDWTASIRGEFDDMRSALEKAVGVQNQITQDMIEIKQTSGKVSDMAEETQKLLSNANLAAGFRVRGSR